MLTLAKYSIGVGDRFAHQAEAQLRACILATGRGVEVVPVWNKSFREHSIIGSQPESARIAAEAAVQKLGWSKAWHVDADHINHSNVGGFIDCCDFFTLDVAEFMGKPGEARLAVRKAGELYRHILARKGERPFITEVSMDETDRPQTPPELLSILAAIAEEGIPAQTIAPKFTGRFNKGVDYVGDVSRFAEEFSGDLAAVAEAVRRYDLPPNLKLSVHSGSDKFSLYPIMRDALKRFDAGVHLKTAGTTWLEELIGLAEAGGDGLALAKEVYAEAHAHREELCAPYAAVIDIDPRRLPPPEAVSGWSSQQFVSGLRHEPACREFNPSLRQLLHVGYKVAAKMGARYLDLLDACRESVSKNVTRNLFERHIQPLFLDA